MVSTRIILSPPERRELQRRARSRRGRADDTKRAKLILKIAAGQFLHPHEMKSLECSQNYIVRWKERFLEERIAGLYARHKGRPPSQEAARLEARILDYTRRGPGDGSTHWSTRKLAKALRISHNKVNSGLGTSRVAASALAPLHGQR